MTYFFYILFGLIGGIFGGMGMGGGTLLIPLLSIFLGMEQSLCQGINLLSFLVMALFSLFIHMNNNLLRFDGIIPLILGGTFFSILGSLIATTMDGKILKILFGVFLCILGIFQFIKVFKKQEK